MTTIRDALLCTTLPRLEARLLLMAATGFDRLHLLAHDDETLSMAQQSAFDALVARRIAGEPVAYLLGEREFYGRIFSVTPDVLIPRPETEHLVDAALERVGRGRAAAVLDLGCGSGAIAVTLALEAPSWQVSAVDLSSDALCIASRNANQLGAVISFHEGSWYAPLSATQCFDLIVSNPPYIHRDDHHLNMGDVRFEPVMALTDGADGLSCLRAIAEGALAHLLPAGWLIVEHGYDQGAACRSIFAASGLQVIETLPDLAGLDRVTLGQAPK
ncbi:peptide chain release factor N(5)-glutamine methyltransferase [Craterilacuibacter sp.]|uniref:peptide chain release factor N(5)-glutamine methyltransferase n=1 Tax=Craterilacuibacter sp. TaxID=2870909 RepID=UPI003F3AD63D